MRFMLPYRPLRGLPSLLVISALTLAACSPTGRMQTSVSVDGMTADFAVVPAALLSDAASSAATHGRPAAHLIGTHHLIVALFEEGSGQRITGAALEAVVTPPAGPPIEKPLEPMTLAGAQAYGNDFDLQARGAYEIAVTLRRAGAARTPVIHFRYEHWPDQGL